MFAAPAKYALAGVLLLASAQVLSFAQDSAASVAGIEVPEKAMASRLIASVPASLPDGALKTKCSNALVVLEVTIDESGKVSGAKAVSGYDELKEPATDAVKQWTYQPYLQNGSPTAIHSRVSIFFLGDGETFPMYSPDGKGGVKGGNVIPLPPGCGPGPSVKRAS